MHFTKRITDYPEEAGYWSVTTADDVHAVSRDWQTFSSERGGITALTNAVMPLELVQAMFIGMDPPRHDRLKNLFQAGFTPRRIAAHEPAIRRIAVDVLESLASRTNADLVTEVAQPIVSRVIGSFMGVPPDADADWARLMNAALSIADPDLSPEGSQTLLGTYVGGRSLSGGEWQRLALARGLMRGQPLLVVLDEPTASLDAPTEAALFERYREAARRLGAANGAVTILVSHRFSTVHMADQIVVLDRGRVLETGTHDELIARAGLYAELFELQAGHYRD